MIFKYDKTTNCLRQMDAIKVIVKDGLPHIDGRLCSYETKKIRSKIQEFAEVNNEFILPKKYTYVITELNGFAKIVKKPVDDTVS